MGNECGERAANDENSLFYTVLHIFAHALYGFIEKLCGIIAINFKILSYFVSKYAYSGASNPFHRVLRLRKIPIHLTVILGDEEPSCQDLANVAIWSIFAGIPFISFYDHKGILCKNEDRLREAVTKIAKEGDHIIWHDNMKESVKNGLLGRKIHIKVLSPNDGKPFIVTAAKVLVDSSEDISIHSVDSIIKEHFVFPDPDLAVYCGEKCATWGYPPWQVRLTEFFGLGTHHNLSPDEFVEVLSRYSKCEQRLGK